MLKLGPHFGARRRDARGRRAIRPELIIATALLYLSAGNTYESVAQSMCNGMTKAVVMRCVRMFNNAMVSEIAPWIITFSRSPASLSRNARYFENRSLIPNIIGAIDGSHIRVAPPKRNEQSYFNRKSFHSVILQAVCDPRGYFMSIDVGFPGRMADSKVMRYTSLYTNAMRYFGNAGYYIYGDAAYPLRPWLMTGYQNATDPDQTRIFNHYGSKARDSAHNH